MFRELISPYHIKDVFCIYCKNDDGERKCNASFISIVIKIQKVNFKMTQKAYELNVSAVPNPSSSSTKVIATLYNDGVAPPNGTPVTFTASGNAFFSNGSNTITGYLTAGRTEQILSVAKDEIVTVEAIAMGYTQSTQVTFTTEPVLNAMSVMAGGFTYTPEQGFPKTGFSMAKALFYINGSADLNSQHEWSCDQSWVSVTRGGELIFTGAPTSETKNVTVTARPLSGVGRIYQYSFSLEKWFINNDDISMNWSDTQTWVMQSPENALATVQEINGSSDYGNGIRGVVGSVWSEWGNMLAYTNSGFVPGGYWSSEKSTDGYHYFIFLDRGECRSVIDEGLCHTLCYRRI